MWFLIIFLLIAFIVVGVTLYRLRKEERKLNEEFEKMMQNIINNSDERFHLVLMPNGDWKLMQRNVESEDENK